MKNWNIGKEFILKKAIIFFISVVFFSGMVSCGASKPNINVADTSAAQKSINSFDDKLFEILSATEGNVNYSAISIYSLMYALSKGSGSDTLAQLVDVLDIVPSQDFEEQLKYILTSTENMSNSIWYKNSFKMQDDYKNFLNQFEFEIKPTDFTKSADVRRKINSFVSNKTHKMIKDFLLGNLDAGTKLVLLNTLYFNQKWQEKFDKKETRKEYFYTNSDEEIKVSMMHKSDYYSYYEDEIFQAIELNYKDSRYSMIIFLPKQNGFDFSGTGLNSLLQKFDSDNKPCSVRLALPKFDLVSKYELAPILGGLGIKDAFSPDLADFSKIFTDSENLFVDMAIHQVKITVDEEKTKAAAVTMFGAKSAPVELNPEITFTADHPFCYVIRDKEHGINLFSGILRVPNWAL